MGRNERLKGMAAEREVRDLINRLTRFRVHRSPHSGALSWLKGDLVGFPGFHLEVKRQEMLRLESWSKQAEEQAGEDQVAAIVYRRSRQPWRISMPLDQFLRLLDGLTFGGIAVSEFKIEEPDGMCEACGCWGTVDCVSENCERVMDGMEPYHYQEEDPREDCHV